MYIHISFHSPSELQTTFKLGQRRVSYKYAVFASLFKKCSGHFLLIALIII